MPIKVSGKRFFNVTDVTEIVEVSRQSIWRWHKAGKIPDGRRYRGRDLLFTREEVEEIYEYAHRLEPAGSTEEFENQLKLFKQNGA
jgi:predicted DNA-binding transcriptional regulator AlpA